MKPGTQPLAMNLIFANYEKRFFLALFRYVHKVMRVQVVDLLWSMILLIPCELCHYICSLGRTCMIDVRSRIAVSVAISNCSAYLTWSEAQHLHRSILLRCSLAHLRGAGI